MDREVTVAEVNQFLTEASKADLQGVLGVETKPLVSIDYVNDPRSGRLILTAHANIPFVQ
jgi:glyceraldehyde 3-phosphate dehydrogenase